MRDRAFGVEIECGYKGSLGEPPDCICEYDEETGTYIPPGEEHCEVCCGCWEDDESDCAVAAQLLQDNGFEDWCFGIHRDGSGVEIPSPVLRGHEGLMQLREVMRLLSLNGFYTGSEDGLHIHHDAPEFVNNPDLVARLCETWIENQHIIDRFVAPDRRSTAEDGYGHWACHALDARHVETFKETKLVSSLGAHEGKFRALNLLALNEHGTIEFRQHEGTLDFHKAAAWIKFGQGLLDSAVRSNRVLTCSSAIDLLRVAGTSAKTRRTLMRAAA